MYVERVLVKKKKHLLTECVMWPDQDDVKQTFKWLLRRDYFLSLGFSPFSPLIIISPISATLCRQSGGSPLPVDESQLSSLTSREKSTLQKDTVPGKGYLYYVYIYMSASSYRWVKMLMFNVKQEVKWVINKY